MYSIKIIRSAAEMAATVYDCVWGLWGDAGLLCYKKNSRSVRASSVIPERHSFVAPPTAVIGNICTLLHVVDVYLFARWRRRRLSEYYVTLWRSPLSLLSEKNGALGYMCDAVPYIHRSFYEFLLLPRDAMVRFNALLTVGICPFVCLNVRV